VAPEDGCGRIGARADGPRHRWRGPGGQRWERVAQRQPGVGVRRVDDLDRAERRVGGEYRTRRRAPRRRLLSSEAQVDASRPEHERIGTVERRADVRRRTYLETSPGALCRMTQTVPLPPMLAVDPALVARSSRPALAGDTPSAGGRWCGQSGPVCSARLRPSDAELSAQRVGTEGRRSVFATTHRRDAPTDTPGDRRSGGQQLGQVIDRGVAQR